MLLLYLPQYHCEQDADACMNEQRQQYGFGKPFDIAILILLLKRRLPCLTDLPSETASS